MASQVDLLQALYRLEHQGWILNEWGEVEFGGVETKKEECRDARGASIVESLVQDLSFGIRKLACRC